MEKQFLLDTHTHTIASGHAYSTITELAKEAADKGLKFLGITEHAPKLPGTCGLLYFCNFKVIPRNMYGVEMAFGTELNILDYDGNVDMPDDIIKTLDVVIASFHEPCYKSGTIKENTNAILKVLEHPYINIIGHPDDMRFPVDYKEVVKKAKENNKLLELNNCSLNPNGFRKGTWENDTIMLNECKKIGQPIIINSDAHFANLVGTNEFALKLIKEVDFPEELVVNYDLDKFKCFVNLSKNK